MAWHEATLTLEENLFALVRLIQSNNMNTPHVLLSVFEVLVKMLQHLVEHELQIADLSNRLMENDVRCNSMQVKYIWYHPPTSLATIQVIRYV